MIMMMTQTMMMIVDDDSWPCSAASSKSDGSEFDASPVP